MEKFFRFLEQYPKVLVIVFFFLWGGFLVLLSLHDHIVPKVIYILAINALVVGQFYLGFNKFQGKRNWVGILLGVIMAAFTLMIDAIMITF